MGLFGTFSKTMKQNRCSYNFSHPCFKEYEQASHTFMCLFSAWGHSPEKGVWGCAALKAPFSPVSCRSQDSQLKHKSIHHLDSHLKEKNVTFPLEKQHFFRKYDNFHLQKLKFDRNFCQKAQKFYKISVLKSLFSMKICSQALSFIAIYAAHKPPSSEIWAAHTCRKKKSCDPPDSGTVVYFTSGVFYIIFGNI